MSGREELDRLREKHREKSGYSRTICRFDGYAWPCPTSRLIAALEEALAGLRNQRMSATADAALSKLVERSE